MLPKETQPEGSRKVLNGVEVYTRHNFTTERGNLFETMDGSYILPNGEPVEDRSLLESLPDPQRQEALAWWDKEFGDGGGVVEGVMDQSSAEDLMAENETLKAQIETLQAESNPVVQKPSVTDLMAENEALKAQIATMQGDSPSRKEPSAGTKKNSKEKDPKNSMRKAEKEPSVLKQMGIPA